MGEGQSLVTLNISYKRIKSDPPLTPCASQLKIDTRLKSNTWNNKAFRRQCWSDPHTISTVSYLTTRPKFKWQI